MGVAAGLYAVGVVLNTTGEMNADAAKASTARQNAYFLKQQIEMQQLEGQRNLSIFDRKATRLKGQQQVHFASSGFGITENVQNVMAQETVLMNRERMFMQRQNDLKVRLLEIKMHQAESAARSYSDPMRSMMHVGKGLLTMGMNMNFGGGGESSQWYDDAGEMQPASNKNYYSMES